MLVVAVNLTARYGLEEELADCFRRLLPPTLAEEGCLQFQAHVDRDDRRLFFVYEQWVDEAALLAHRETAHYREIVPQIDRLVEGRDRRLLEPVVG